MAQRRVGDALHHWEGERSMNSRRTSERGRRPFSTTFSGGGYAPEGSVSFDTSGDLYGTFDDGGQYTSGGVFRLRPKGGGSQTTFSFDGADGLYPVAGVLVDQKRHAIYGTTWSGGASNGGTVFTMTGPAEETVLYSFCSESNCADGSQPSAGLVQDKLGNLYGATEGGGTFGDGVIFELTP